MLKKKIFGFVAVGMLGVFLSACGGENQTNGQSVSTGGNTEGTELSGQVSIDGSTTVFPIMEAVSEEFKAVYPNVKAPIGTSGTGGGFKLFTAGSTDLSNASRLIKNKEKAFKVLRSRLYDLKLKEQNDEISAERRSQVGSGDRSERIRTYNFPQGRVTDHRIGLTIYKLDSFLDGEIDEVVDGLITSDQAEKMKNF